MLKWINHYSPSLHQGGDIISLSHCEIDAYLSAQGIVNSGELEEDGESVHDVIAVWWRHISGVGVELQLVEKY